MSSSLWPHGLQLARLPCLLLSAGVQPQIHVYWICDDIQSSHFLPSSSLFAFNVSQHQSLFQSYLTLNASLCAVLNVSVLSDFATPWTSFTGKNTGVGCHFLLQGIFPTQEWYSISSIFCIGRKILYPWATWEAQTASLPFLKHKLILI